MLVNLTSCRSVLTKSVMANNVSLINKRSCYFPTGALQLIRVYPLIPGVPILNALRNFCGLNIASFSSRRHSTTHYVSSDLISSFLWQSLVLVALKNWKCVTVIRLCSFNVLIRKNKIQYNVIIHEIR